MKIQHMYLDFSSFDTYRQCPRKFAWGLVEGLESAEPTDPSLSAPFKGTVIHECLDAIYRGASWEAKLEELLKPEYAINDIPSGRSGGPDHLRDLLTQYVAHYTPPEDPEYKITATEQRLEMPLTPWLTWVGTVDKVALSQAHNAPVIIDHKSSSSLARWVEPAVPVSDQFTGYIALAQANGIATSTLVIDGISTALKAAKDGQGLFTRYITTRNGSQVEEFKARVIRCAVRMKEDIEANIFGTNQPKACNDFGSQCPFYDACVASGSGRTNVLRNSYQKAPPWKNFKIQWETQ